MSGYIIYTDGACKGNPGRGASAYVILDETENHMIKYKSTYYPSCTNNYVELMAIITALDFLYAGLLSGKKTTITIKSDSEYCVDGCNMWMYDWNKKGKLSNRLNGDIWKNIFYIVQVLKRLGNKIEFVHIKGHSGIKWNDYCDKLAKKTIESHTGVES